MKIKIYQVEHDRDTHNVAFMGSDSLEKFQGSPELDSSIYDCVFEGDVNCKYLEEVYSMFNYQHPAGYRARSLSKSDVVEVIEDDKVKPGFYFCDTFGFKKMKFEPDKSQISERFYRKEDFEKIKVLFVPVGKYPVEMEIENTYEAMKELLGGGTEEYMPYDDAIALVANRDGFANHLPENRAVYAAPKKTEMDYSTLKNLFREAEDRGEHLTAHIVFVAETFKESLSDFERTYAISSNNKAFQSGMGGYSIYGSSLDGVERCVRLEGLMAAEHGGKDGWKIEKCYLIEPTKEISAIIRGDFFIAKSNVADAKYDSLSPSEMKQYRQLFKYPERFEREHGGVTVVPFKPAIADKER